MQIEFKTRTLEKDCLIAQKTIKKYGKDMAELIHRRLDVLTAVESLDYLLQYRVNGCHQLKGKRKNQYAMDLVQPFRLIFELNGCELNIIRIIEITNYH